MFSKKNFILKHVIHRLLPGALPKTVSGGTGKFPPCLEREVRGISFDHECRLACNSGNLPVIAENPQKNA
jgi:hypothetical protein